MVPSRDLAARFEAYGDWRRRLSAGVSALHDWLQDAGPGRRPGRPAGPAAARAPAPGQAGRRVRRRVLARQVRADQRDLLRGLRRSACCPPPAGRTTMCPTELLYDAARPPSIRLLPIETRLKDATVAEFKNYADEWVTFAARPRVRREDGRGAVARVAGQARAGRARAQVRALRRRRGRHPRARSSTATKAASTSRAGATRSSTSRTRCCSRGW